MSTTGGKRYDCIVVGGGHNGLVCAAYLAQSGRSVLVLEAAAEVGGAAVTREFASGFRVSAGAHLLHLMPPALMRELALERHGLKLAASNLPTVALAADGAHLVLDGAQLADAAGRPAVDTAAYAAWRTRMQRLAAALHPLLAAAPPRLGTGAWRERAALLGLGWRIRRLGRTDMRELLRIGGMCVYDLLQDEFQSPLLQGALAVDALLGTNYGPRSPGTVFTLLYRLAASGTAESLAQPQGGLGALSQALARAASAAGAEIRTGQAVARILVEDDRVRGVALESGEELSAASVISSADPKTTFLRLLGSEHLDAGFTRRVAQLRSRGVAAKLHLALDRLPEFTGLSERQLRGRVLVAPSLDYLERAYNHSKYREFSSAPMLEITIPTLADPTLAAPGKHVMSVIAQYAPYALEGGWNGAAGQSFADLVIDSIAGYAPQLRSVISAVELLTPADIEREFRIAGGHWHHAELALDQFFMVRPLPGAAQYRAPVSGLYLCGAACHPGGGVMGLAGRNAARQLLGEAA